MPKQDEDEDGFGTSGELWTFRSTDDRERAEAERDAEGPAEGRPRTMLAVGAVTLLILVVLIVYLLLR
jgi:hypothetical protein